MQTLWMILHVGIAMEHQQTSLRQRIPRATLQPRPQALGRMMRT